jgi:hypothetical protein
MALNIPRKNANIYSCNTCNFTCSKQSNYDAHVLTRKHKTLTNTYEILPKNATMHICSCGKKYKHRQSLYTHKSQCLQIYNPTQDTSINIPALDIHNNYTTPIPVDDPMQTNIILELVKQNQEFKQLLIEQNKTIIELAKNGQVNNNTINNTSNINNNNKTFNLNFFLNETCKDAMNMKDFIQSLELSLPELEKMGEIGFAEGMSRVFVNRLNSLDVTKRPIHCSDVKREIIHIKDDNKWERDNANLDRLRKIIKQLTHKNILRVDDWKKANPGCTEYNSRKNDQYLKINMEAIGPVEDEEVKRDFSKIIRRVAENTTIDKKYLCV